LKHWIPEIHAQACGQSRFSNLVASAVANAEENFGVSRDDLYVAASLPMKPPPASGAALARADASSRFCAALHTSPLFCASAEHKENFMGRKVHPVGFRLGINQPWGGRWFAEGKPTANSCTRISQFATCWLVEHGGAAANEKVRVLSQAIA
jgi:hypothetical protein